MSTRRCLSMKCLRLWQCARPASMSTQRSAAAATARAFSSAWRRRPAHRHRPRPGGHRRGPRALCARAATALSCKAISRSWRRWCARRDSARSAMASCSISASPRRNWTIQRAASASVQDGPLDMRMDPTRGEPVSAWLARASGDEMRHVIATLGEERFAGPIAREIVRAPRGWPADPHQRSWPHWSRAQCARANRASIRLPAPSRRCAFSSMMS